MKGNAVMGFVLAALAVAGVPATAAAWDCVPGRYVGTTWSVHEGLHEKEVTLVVSKQKEACELRFKSAATGADEIWEMSGNTLLQRELDATGKEKLKYGATLEVRSGTEGYYVNCAEGGKSACDAGVDSRSFWKIEGKGSKVVYSLWGVDPAKRGDSAAPVRKRIEYIFSPAP